MEKVLGFILEYGYIILYIAIATVVCVTMGWQWTKARAYALMLQAKKLAKDEVLSTGAEQEQWVVSGLYILLKKLKIPFITKEALQPIVHNLYVKAMDWLDDGKLNNSIK